MNKKDIVKAVAAKTGYTQKDVATAIDAFIETIESALAAGQNVSIPNFGKFVVTERAARQARNPMTGESVQVKAKNVAKFKPSISLKAAVAGA